MREAKDDFMGTSGMVWDDTTRHQSTLSFHSRLVKSEGAGCYGREFCLRPRGVCQVRCHDECGRLWIQWPVVTQLTQRFTLFRADGTPVRATLTLEFTEYLDPKKDQLETDPEFTTRLFKRGDSLSAIAAEAYSDPTLWRVVAEANQLDDPRKIAIGVRLNIPKLG